MLRKLVVSRANTFIYCRHVSQSMVQTNVDEKSGNIL